MHKISDRFDLAQFRLLAWELPDLEGPVDFRKCPGDSDFIFDQIFIRFTGNEDSHKIFDEFDFEADGTIDMRITCPLVYHRHIMGKMLSRR